jgi:Flp pilus assembly pilin Flp
MKPALSRASGVTLVELLVTGIISVVVISGVVAFFDFIGNRMEGVSSEQQLGIEGSFIAEEIMRTVRQGDSVDVPNKKQLDIYLNGIRQTSYQLAQDLVTGEDTLKRAVSAGAYSMYTTPFRCTMKNDSFFVYANRQGAGMDFTLVNRNMGFPDTMAMRVNAVCKNGTPN